MENKSRIYGMIILYFLVVSCSKDGLMDVENNFKFPQYLSELNIYHGNMADLTPENDFQLYELASPLFTDYAEKQRLIKVPFNATLTKVNDGLPDFPDGTILVKTFFYYQDAQKPELGKRIIETRILQKNNSIWNVGTYLWNEAQTNATFIESGYNTSVNWIDRERKPQVIAYHVPNSRECAACHQSDKEIIPIGPKLRNLNRDVIVEGVSKNQLIHFQDLGLIDGFNIDDIGNLPAYSNSDISLEERGRAYLEINCAHCHRDNGLADDVDLNFDYDIPFAETNIGSSKDKISDQFSTGKMPLIGTSIIDKEGLELLKNYIGSL